MLESRPATRFFLYIPALPEIQDRILLDRILPLVRAISEEPGLLSVSFARTGVPEPLIRLAVVLEPGKPQERAREILEEAAGLARTSLFREQDLPGFADEIRRWGGPEGIALAERIFHHDSVACLERIELESRSAPRRSRREWSLLLTESFLDLLRFGPKERIDFHRRGHLWAIERGEWSTDDLPVLESKYRAIRGGLGELLAHRQEAERGALWGGDEAATIAERSLARLGPVLEEWLEARDAGRLTGDAGQLVWSFAHVHALRLGIEPIAEAILRYYVFRLLEEHAVE